MEKEASDYIDEAVESANKRGHATDNKQLITISPSDIFVLNNKDSICVYSKSGSLASGPRRKE